MGFKSVYYSINHILRNKNINRPKGLVKYFVWQFIKVFNLFPLKIKVSDSLVEIKNKKLSLEGGTKIYTQGMYDYNNMNLIKYTLQKNFKEMLDIGTNIGLYSLIASEVPNAKVYSFEPHPYTFGILKEQIKLNNRSNIHPVNKAVSNENKIVSFSDDAGSSINKIISDSESSNSIKIEACKISDFCNEKNIIPEIVKIDVEGFELEVLQGFEEKIKEVKIFIIEISKNWDEINQLLITKNFSGPFYFNFKSKSFSGFNNSQSIEDPIYLNNSFRSLIIDKVGISINEK